MLVVLEKFGASLGSTVIVNDSVAVNGLPALLSFRVTLKVIDWFTYDVGRYPDTVPYVPFWFGVKVSSYNFVERLIHKSPVMNLLQLSRCCYQHYLGQ